MAFRFNLSDVFEQYTEQHPDWNAFAAWDERTSFQKLYDRVLNWAFFLKESGVSKGDIVGLSIAEETLHLELTWALVACGAASLNLSSARTTQQLRDIARAAQIDLHICSGQLNGALSERVLFVKSQDCPSGFEQFLSSTFKDENAPLLLFSTSGTTAAPKVFARKVGFMAAGIEGTRVSFLKLFEEEGCQCNLLRGGNVEYDNNRVARFTQTLAGGINSIMDPVDTGKVSEFCARSGVTIFSTSAFQLQSMLSDPDIQRLPDDVMLTVGGAPIPRDTRRGVQQKLTDTFRVIYATSEIGIVAMAGADDHEKSENCLGVPVPEIEVSLRSADNQAVPHGEAGIAWVRTGSGMTRYLSGETAENDGGWFNTGDVLSYLPDGSLSFHGRADEMIVLNGINIFPQAIEEVLMEFYEVKEAVAFGLPSARHGQIPVAIVVLETNAIPSDIEFIMRKCRSHLGFQAPRAIKIRKKIPRTQQGKISRRLLQAEFP